MPAFRIDDAEWDLLAGEPAELLKLYCALKRRMDFATGIAGRKTLINEIVLREGFTVDPIPGRPKPRPVTREMYRSAVRRLEKLGLLVSIAPMVFEFPCARRDRPSKTATTELQPEPQPQQQPAENPLEPTNCAASGQNLAELQPQQEPGTFASYNLLPVSGVNPTAHIAHACASARFPMHDAWEPDRTTFHAVLYRNGMGNVRFHPDQLLEFRSYWIARPDKHQTQAQWEHQLAQQLKRTTRTYETEGPRHEASGRPAAGRARSAYDILTDDNW